MLPTWDVSRLESRIPFVAAAVGGRRMGKSTLVTHLLETMSSKFDLVISFTGTSACSPEMKHLMETRWDPRFQFAEWRQGLVGALLLQQEALKERGISRQICVLVDDIILSSKDEDALSHLCLRGRHFNISVLACSVSYTTLPKRCRRALDVLFLFSCPMSGDCKILCAEYANQARMARYLLQQLPEFTCLVMETLTQRQRLYHYRVDRTCSQSVELPSAAQDQTEVSHAISEENRAVSHQSETSECSGRNSVQESGESAVLEKLTEHDHPSH